MQGSDVVLFAALTVPHYFIQVCIPGLPRAVRRLCVDIDTSRFVPKASTGCLTTPLRNGTVWFLRTTRKLSRGSVWPD